MNKKIVTVALVIMVIVGGYFLFQDSYSKSKPSTTSTTKSPIPSTPSSQAAQRPIAGEIMIEGDEYKFLPSAINLTAGEKVKIIFKNTGNLPHNLLINELGIETATIVGGKTTSIEVTPEKSGTYTFYCSIGNHRSLGMEGTMEVK